MSRQVDDRYADAGYFPPDNAAEQQVWTLSETYRSLPPERRERVREDLDKFRKSDDLRMGYKVLAGYLRHRIKRLHKS